VLLKTRGINAITNATPRLGMGPGDRYIADRGLNEWQSVGLGASLGASGIVALEASKSKPVMMRGALNPRRFSREQLV
jgi:hypothetical protein